MPAATLAALWAAELGWSAFQHRLPLFVWVYVLAVNIATLLVYRHDKRSARAGSRRVRERTLHLFALAGGWPAARLAQQVLRHKTIKPGFQAMYWLTVVLNLAALSAYVFREQIKPLLN